MGQRDDDEGLATAHGLLELGGALFPGAAGRGAGLMAMLGSKVKAALAQHRRERERVFLERVGGYLDANDPEGAAAFVDANVGAREFADVLERGYERMKRAYDPAAEECICLLTAEHLRVGKDPARRYVATGALLEACDSHLLSALRDISDAYRQTPSDPRITERIVFDLRSHADHTDRSRFVVVGYADDEECGRSQVFRVRPLFRRALTLLDQFGFGRSWDGFGRTGPKDLREVAFASCRHGFLRSDDEAMLLLARCLTPVRPVAEPTDEGP